tara:strand:- start:1 stop:960 length:960 start_codon:yes stop_codon:yes gene_type:complete
MAQTGFTPIQLYFSSTATNVPLAANLANGELAINITDGKLFYKDNAAAVQVIGWKVVPATAGGTGQTSYAVGDLLYADTTTTLAKLADVATGNALISGGVGIAPSWGKIGLTTHVSGVLPVANGGTNASTASITSFNNITGYSASGATGTTTTNLVFSTSPSITTPTLVGDATLSTGNLVIGTSGKGIDFSATSGTGTSELFADYEEGTWTPTITNVVGIYTLTSVNYAQYTKIGQVVYGFLSVTVTTPGTASDSMNFTLPFVPTREGYGSGRENLSSGDMLIPRIITGGSGEGRLYKTSGAAAGAGVGTYVVSFMFLT